MGEVGRHVLGSQGRRLAPLPTGEVGRGAKEHAGATGHIRTAGLAEVDPVLFHSGNLPENGTERKLGRPVRPTQGTPRAISRLLPCRGTADIAEACYKLLDEANHPSHAPQASQIANAPRK